MKKHLTILFVITFCISCINNTEIKDGEIGQGIDISNNGNLILLSYALNGGISIFEYDVSKSNLTQVTNAGKAWHLRPKYSPTQDSLLYIEYPNHDFKSCNLILSSKSNKEKQVLLSNRENLTEAVFSKDGKSIYFINATSIGKIPNGNDLYSLDLKTGEIKKITDYESYSFSNLKVLNDSMMIANVNVMGTINLQNGIFKNLSIKNDPRQGGTSNFTAIDIKDSILFYYAPYQVYKYDMKKRLCTLEINGKGKGHMYSIHLNDEWNKLFYTESSRLFICDLNKKTVEEIILN